MPLQEENTILFYTFHHIVSRHNGGQDNVNNGAILTRSAHDLLHMLEYACPKAYEDLQEVFRYTNNSRKPVTENTLDEIDSILYRLFNGDGYEIAEDVDLSIFVDMYYDRGKKRKRKVNK